uniref:Uncharacterized protein n=1 Tax=Arion vulgaris TaxID=1028688 RepID=A0A0B7C194_9EUPU
MKPGLSKIPRKKLTTAVERHSELSTLLLVLAIHEADLNSVVVCVYTWFP